jgi:hypothetical protein
MSNMAGILFYTSEKTLREAFEPFAELVVAGFVIMAKKCLTCNYASPLFIWDTEFYETSLLPSR